MGRIPSREARFNVYAGMFLISLSIIMFEVSLTRVFSVVMWYHFAFFSVTLAMFGLTLSAVTVYLFPKLFRPEKTVENASLCATLFAITCLASISVILNLCIPLSLSAKTIGYFFLLFLLLVLPCYAGGLSVTLILSQYHAQIDRIYFADLVGAGIGSIAIIYFMNHFGGTGAFIGISLLGALAGLVFSSSMASRKTFVFASVAFLLIVVFAVGNAQGQWLKIRYAKGEKIPALLYEGWNSFSRISVHKNVSTDKVLHLDIDEGATTFIFKSEDGKIDLPLSWDGLPEFVYFTKQFDKILIIGPGGGGDIAAALTHGNRSITAAELNPLIVQIMKNNFADYSGNIYNNPAVQVFAEDGRVFVDHNINRKWDLIQISLVDTLAATQSGALSLSENSLYTVEAFMAYMEHLTPSGMLNVTYLSDDPPAMSARIAATIRESSDRLGIPGIDKRVMIIGGEANVTFIVKKSPFTQNEITNIETISQKRSKPVFYSPHQTSDNIYSRLILDPSPRQIYDHYEMLIAPVSDNSPFFFNVVRFKNILSSFKSKSYLGSGIFFLIMIATITVIFSLMTILLPLFVLKRKELTKNPGIFTRIFYFAILGFSYIAIELCLIQKLSMFIGSPTLSFAVVIATLLICSGIGSLVSAKVPQGKEYRILFILVCCLLCSTFVVDAFVDYFIYMPRMMRIILTMLFVVPIGFLMGMPFPLGIRSVSKWNASTIPWMWAINGVMSILGASLEAFLAIYVGFKAVLLIAAIMYFIALVFFPRIPRDSISQTA